MRSASGLGDASAKAADESITNKDGTASAGAAANADANAHEYDGITDGTDPTGAVGATDEIITDMDEDGADLDSGTIGGTSGSGVRGVGRRVGGSTPRPLPSHPSIHRPTPQM